jgi:hypothetical protein
LNVGTIVAWANAAQITGPEMTFILQGYKADSISLDNPDAAAMFSCTDPDMVRLPASVCK